MPVDNDTDYELDIDAIRERIAAMAEANRKRQGPRPRRVAPGRRQIARTRARLSAATYAHHRATALADPGTHSLRRARLTFKGEGLTIRQLADRAVVSPDAIQCIEARRSNPSDLMLKRLARALDTTPDAISDG